jgi:GNAT superfamily N-acetyltransferase
MIELSREQIAALHAWFLPERPGPLIGAHVLHTGNGVCLADRWPDPRALLVKTAGNYSLAGDARALTPGDLKPHIKGYVEAPPAFVPLLEAACTDLVAWPRVIYAGHGPLAPTVDEWVRRLEASDAEHLRNLSPDSAWIGKTWGGPEGLASSGYGWGAFVDGQLAAVACTFFLGATCEDIGVATEPGYRNKGLSTACVRGLCGDMSARGHLPSWTTSPDNIGSIRVAEKLGFAFQRTDVLYVTGIALPKPAQPEG